MNSLVVRTCFTDNTLKDDKPGCKNFSARCRFCLNKRISGNITSTTNFLNHVKEHHPQQYQTYLATKAVSSTTTSTRKRKRELNDDDCDTDSTEPHQLKVPSKAY